MIILIFLSYLIITLKRNNIAFINFIYSVVIGVATLFWLTEFLSFFKMITFGGILIGWIIINVVALSILIKVRRNYSFSSKFKPLPKDKKVLVLYAVVAVILMISIIIGITMVPCNYDTMTYHLSRLVHWTHNRSVSYYATHTLRQLTSPMLSEYIMLHTYILLGCNDQFVNLVQTFSHILNVLIIWNISRKLGLKSVYSFLAAFIYMTTPIALAESFTTQNDVLTTVWLLIFVYILLDYVGEKKIEYNVTTAIDVLMLGLCVGFGYLSKPSVCIPIFFFVLWLLISSIKRKDSIITIVKCVSIAGVAAILPMIPGFYRNYAMMGQLTAHITGARQLVGTAKPNYLVINFLKNLTYNLPNILDKNSSEHIYSFVTKVANMLKVNIDDPSISEDGVAYMVYDAFQKEMDSAVNPLIVTFIAIAILLIIVLCIKKKHKNSLALSYSMVSIVAFIGILGVVRWEPFVSRYMIANMALCSVAIAIQLQLLTTQLNRYIGYVLVSLLILGGGCEYVLTMHNLKNYYNIYDSRIESYYTLNYSAYEAYKKAVDYIIANDLQTVGFLDAENYYDYPLYKMLEGHITDYRHVIVKREGFTFNDSYKYEDPTYQPDCIYITANYYEEDDQIEYNGATYEAVYSDDGWTSLFVRVQ